MVIDKTFPSVISLLGRLRLRHLALVVAIDQLGSLRKAAERIGISQPAATKMLVELEDSLGLPLFDRGRRGMLPTVYGQTLIRHAHLLLSDIEAMRDDLAGLAAGASGRLAIGTITAAAAGPLAVAVATLKQRRPRLDISIIVETSDVLLPMLDEGRLDMVIGRAVSGLQARNTSFTRIEEERLCIVVGAYNPLAKREKLTLAELAECGWILQPITSPLRQVVEATFRDAAIRTPENVVETASILLATTLLQQSDMIGVVPLTVAGHYVASGQLHILPLDLHRQLEPYGIITRRGRSESPAVKEMMRLIQRD